MKTGGVELFKYSHGTTHNSPTPTSNEEKSI